MTGEGKDITPRPDPTRLTTEQLYREVLWLRELLEQRVGSLEQIVETRFKERDERFSQIEVTLRERGQRIASLESQSSTILTRVATMEAARSGSMSIVGPIIGLGTLVLAAIGLLMTHILREGH